jgi:hypothetical protein
MPTAPASSAPWLLLVHQLPARPAYQRVKLRRRLQALGAVPVKKTVQVLPASADALEDFQWIAKELEAAGGDAFVCEARLVEGVTDAQLRALFDQARDADYRSVAQEAAASVRQLSGKRRANAHVLSRAQAALPRLRKRLAEIGAIDFFGANGGEAAEIALRELETHLMRQSRRDPAAKPAEPVKRALKELKGKVWVTRRHVHVDRIACAWLIRAFIDPKARFKFVEATGYAPRSNELRYDMADAEFTHRGDRCSFEVLLAEAGLADPALQSIAEIVHDLDLKDGKFGRPEAAGVRQLIAGIALGTDDDPTRVTRGSELFADLYRSLQRKPASAGRRS